MLYEGGIRVPWIFRWPGRIAAGSECGEPIASVDLFPTLLEVAGAAGPKQPLDGVSCAKLLASAGKDRLKREGLFWHFPGYLGAGQDSWRTTPVGVIRAGDWKLMEFFEDGRLELYNLRDDVGEQNNLAKSMPDKTRELHNRLLAWRKEINAPLPTPNTPQTAAAETKAKAKGKGKNKAKAK